MITIINDRQEQFKMMLNDQISMEMTFKIEISENFTNILPKATGLREICWTMQSRNLLDPASLSLSLSM